MSSDVSTSPSQHGMHRLLITALVVHVGIETLRAMLPLLVFGLRDRFGWSAWGPIGAVLILLISLLLFSLAFTAGRWTRRLGRSPMIRGCVLGLVALRLMAQLWSADPIGNLVAMALCVLCFLLFWPPWMQPPTAADAEGHRRTVALGVLLGTLISATLHGVLLTYDAIWRRDPLHIALSLILMGCLVILLRRLPEDTQAAPQGTVSSTVAASWFALGPFVFLHLLIFLNLARSTVLLGWSQSHSATLQVLGHWLALAVVALWASRSPALPLQRAVWGTATVTLWISLFNPWPLGLWAAAGQLLGTVALAVLWWMSATRPGRASPQPTTAHRSHGVGMLVLLFLLFLYYAGYDLPLPFDQVRLLPFAALLMALAAWPKPAAPSAGIDAEATDGATDGATASEPSRQLVSLTAFAALLIALPWMTSWLRSPPADLQTPAPENGQALRVMTYNLHCGFGPDGYLRLEEQAATIAAMDADIVALQEISRGWVINGGVDILAWLAQRLGMDYRFAPTADPLWGNATLSRRPILASRQLEFPRGAKQQIRRGLVEITVAADLPLTGTPGADGELTVINTHFHHRRADGDVRVGQTRVLLDFWNRRSHTLIVGDLNARPDSPEMRLLAASGLIDTVQRHGITPGYTFRANAPDRRIDYIWATPDLVTQEVTVVPSTASDHLGIVVQLAEGPHGSP